MEREEQRKGGKERGKIGRRWRGKDSGRDGKRGKVGRRWRGKDSGRDRKMGKIGGRWRGEDGGEEEGKGCWGVGGVEEEGLTQGVARSARPEAKRLAEGGRARC